MKLTPWFPIEILPVRVGVYNVSCQSEDQSGDWYSYFDGTKFGYFVGKYDGDTRIETAGHAFRARDNRTRAEVLSWRGILK
jgi:hypothetical protein